jgi:hypothetical protein
MLFPDKPVVSKITDLDAILIDRYHPPHDMHYSGLGVGHKTIAPNELIAQVYRAYSRLLRRDKVYQWFEERDFDLGQPTISKHLFEAAVRAEFGQLPAEPVKPATDDALVAEAIEGLKSEKYPNVWQAAQALAPRAKGSDIGTSSTPYPAKVYRLNKKIGNAYIKISKPSQNISKQMK